MKRIIEFPTEGETKILIEVEEADRSGGVRRGAPGEVYEKAKGTFTEALYSVKPVAEGIISKLRDLSHPPDAVEVEFGIKISAEAGAFIASASSEANFTVTLNWKRKE